MHVDTNILQSLPDCCAALYGATLNLTAILGISEPAAFKTFGQLERGSFLLRHQSQST